MLALDGAGTGLAGAETRLEPDPVLLARLVEAGATPGTVASTDLFYDPPLDSLGPVARNGPLALDLQAAAILGVAARHAAEAAVVVGITAQDGGGG